MESTYTSTGFVGFSQAVVIDVETTGLKPAEDRVVSVAAIRVDFTSMAKTGEANAQSFSALLNPDRPIPAKTTAIHGINDNDVADAERFADIAAQLREFIGDLPVIGHNVQFDKKFLNAEFKRAKVKTLSRNKSYCTLMRTREYLGHTGQGFRKVKLDEAARVFELQGRRSPNHDALEDAQIALQIAAGYFLVDNDLKQPSPNPAKRAVTGASELRSPSEYPGQSRARPLWQMLVFVAALVLVAIWVAISIQV